VVPGLIDRGYKMSKQYYAADNHYGNESSIGFANTWYVLAFASKAARDDFVDGSDKASTRAIKASEIKQYGNIGEVAA